MSNSPLASILMFVSFMCAILWLAPSTASAQSVPSPLVISELRFRGYFGSNDEYVELYNNTDSDIVVSTTDGSAGWAVAEYGGYRLQDAGNAVIPNGTVIKARSHLLVANYYQSGRSVVRLYDCCNYVTYGYFDGHQEPDDFAVAIFTTNNQANFTDAYRLDSVGFSTIPSGVYREGVGLPPIGSTPGEYAFVRRANGFQLQDTNDNFTDFQFVSTTGGVWNGVQSRLGAPAPENGNSVRRGNLPGNAAPTAGLLDTNAAANAQPNEVRDYQPVGNGTQGTFELRRKITNTTGATITKLRLRVNDITGFPQQFGLADLRVLSSADKSVQLSNGSTVTLKGTTLDQAPTQFLGGGVNSSISIPLPGGSLANGASVSFRIVLGVMQTGDYRFDTDIPLGNTQGTITPGAANASIFGKIGNSSDGPAIGFGGVTVILSGSQTATTTTDANGDYAFNNLPVGGSYSVTPSKAGFTFAPVLQQVANLSGNQELDFNCGFNKPQAGDIVFSEFRERGPAGDGDEFVEIYNNTDTDFTVSTDDESDGWSVLQTGYGYFVIPNGTVIKARQHIAGTFFYTAYSGIDSVVNTYAGINPFDYPNWGYYDGYQLPDDQGLAMFKTNNAAHFNTSYRLDAVGFTTTANSLFKEGAGLPPMGVAQPEYSFVRRAVGFTAQDTDNNAADWVFVTTDGGVYNGVQSVLGAPGPETSSAPIRANLPGVCGLTKSILDPDVAANTGENLVSAGGTVSIRRKITNGSSIKITRVRFRVVDISTLGNRGPGEADLRVVSSTDTTATLSNGATVTIKGTTLDQPPSQPNGGGLNSSLSVALPSGGLSPGASINVQFLLNVAQPGTYRFEIDVPETPCDTTGPSTVATVNPNPNAAGWNNGDVTVNLDASDNANGSGIKQINYVASGGTSIPLTSVNSATVPVLVTGEGQTVITYFARDNASNTESPHTLVVKIDKTAPVISNIPSPTVEATSSSGATVTWTGPSVSDNLDPNATISCSRLSGSSFPMGDTQVTCTASDQAGNSSTASFTVTVNPPADPIPPVTSGLLSPGANANGWNNSDVLLSLSASDNAGGSGVKEVIYSASGAQTIPATTISGSSASLAITVEGMTTVTYFARDNAGNTEGLKTVVIRIDKTPPVIDASRTPAANAAGWNKEDVTANYTASDSLSGLDPSSPANGSFVFSSEGANQSHTFTVTDAAGNMTSVTVGNVNVDKTAPTLDSPATAGGNPYVAGAWTNHPVTVSFNCTDGGSGVADVTQPVTVNSEGVNQSASGQCTDIAGNSVNVTFDHIKIDMTAPAITASRTPAANASGWNNGDVTASYSASDALSGLNSPANGSFTFTSEGANQSHVFTVTDAAGNSANATIDHVSIDKTAPALSCASADGLWHAADVTIACTATESISSLTDAANANFNLVTSVAGGTETANASTNSRAVCDVAGNCATAGPINGNKVDKKPPTITITAPAAGSYLLNQAVTVQFTCTDGRSGVASCNGTSANGGPLDTATAGGKTFTVNATDNAGNSAAPVVVNYTVGFGVVALYDQTKAAKSGSTIPIKIRLVDANGANVSSTAITVHAVSVVQTSSQTSPLVADSGNSNPDFDFRYDAALGGYIFNLQTRGYGTGSYLLNLIAGGGPPVYSVGFQVRQ
ncbi:MAG TPA: HYR domain-containing protein [Pyrinomonadaceae bacterium]|nr:HYR domain-containing protein [Pyrinomonadaceae bacterium]